MLFSANHRDDQTPMRSGESTFEFYNRVSGPLWDRIRELLEAWTAEFEPDGQADIRGRLTSGDDHNFHSAFWELYLHHSLSISGYELQHHPVLKDVETRPDYYVRREDHSFYLEAVVSSAGDIVEQNSKLRGQIYDFVNGNVSSTEFIISIDFEDDGESTPKLSRIARAIRNWLGDLDYPRAREILVTKSIEDLPTLTVSPPGWTITLTAFARDPDAVARGPAERVIGAYPPIGGSYDEVPYIRAALKEKASRYGSLDAPLVIALLRQSMLFEPGDAEQAILGSEEEWKGVAAVLTANNLHPARVGTETPILWVISRPNGFQLDLPHIIQRSASDSIEPTVAPYEFFELDEEWPGPEPRFPR